MSISRNLTSALLIALWATGPALAAEQPGNFRAAAVKVDITPATSKWLAGYPARQSTGVHDHLFHRILVDHLRLDGNYPRLEAWIRRVDELPRA